MQCAFRFSIQPASSGSSETARCRLLEQMVGQECENFRVPADACTACLQHSGGQSLHGHPVFPSMLLQISETALENATQQGTLTPEKERRLNGVFNTAMEALTTSPRQIQPSATPSCDVILCAHESNERLHAAIVSILEQEGVVPFLHLVDTGDASRTFNEFSGRWNVRRHRQPSGTSTLAAVHELIESMSTSLIAIQPADGISTSDRLARSINQLESEGAEIFAAQVFTKTSALIPMQTKETLTTDETLTDENSRQLNPATLVFRRCSFVDMGGIAGVENELVSFVERAHRQQRRITISPEALIELLPKTASFPSITVSPIQSGDILPDSESGKGFPAVPVEVDVVLPFHGHLDYVDQALEGLLNQERCKLVIHLIDDASPEDTTDFLRHWSKHCDIRTYRNRENIGQFQSFNNVVRYFETPLCAVQDADDISLPNRLWWAGQMLHYSDADVFGATVELFGDEHVIRPIFTSTEPRVLEPRVKIRRSFFPLRGRHGYFLENPTAVFRVDMFKMLGGFADFGDRLMNRASIDSEFQQRLLFHGTRFAISREVLVKYRVHPESATQDTQSGWGTAARTKAGQILDARVSIFERGPFDPRAFGSLGRYQNVTERFE
ncbi:MAG: glycosyltransferase [Planctomycetota bacterium]|nr:MAG: glycosyltransferase [Planctomycetota bacterium]